MSAPIRYRFGRFELQPDQRRLQQDGVPLHLGPHAFDLLVALVDHAGHLVTKQALLARVWAGVVVEENSLQAQVSALRKLVGAEAIATVSGQGYRFEMPVQAVTDHLPQALTTFIGREKEIAEIRAWLASGRLVTLTGAGGCGKSRLALQVAGTLADAYPQGVRLVELAPLADPTLVAQAVAKALAVEAAPGRDLVESIAEWLAPRRMVLVLDNAEHLLEACAALVDALLRRCPRLVVIATSRERLRIDGEYTYRVPSLSADESARLFVDRARMQHQDFEPNATLASVCRRLDGIALAIELAAPQLRVMSLEELDARLDDRFAVLTGGSRTALPRHRTLRSLIDWSFDLLSGPEQVLMRRLSVFAGGWTLASAERVCGGGEVLDLLRALEDKNLVVAEAKGGTVRFRMLETVREYAQQRLRDGGDAAAVHGRLVEFLVDLAAGLDTDSDDMLQATLRSFDAEHDNLRVALAWCESHPERTLQGLRLAALLVGFWRIRGVFGEGLRWLTRLRSLAPAGERGETEALALHAIGTLLGVHSDQAAAAARLGEAVELWRRLGQLRQAARSLACLGEVEWYRGNAQAAREAFARALPISRECKDMRNVADALCYSAEMARIAGEHAEAQALLDESLGVSRGIGHWAHASTLAYLAALDYSRGELERARSTWYQALPGYREFGDRQGICGVLMLVSMVSLEMGEAAVAASTLREAWDALPGGNDNELLYWLDASAGLLVAQDRAADAVRVCGCIARHREDRGLERPDSARYRRMLDAARHALRDDAAFDRAWNEGRTWTLDDAGRVARDFTVSAG